MHVNAISMTRSQPNWLGKHDADRVDDFNDFPFSRYDIRITKYKYYARIRILHSFFFFFYSFVIDFYIYLLLDTTSYFYFAKYYTFEYLIIFAHILCILCFFAPCKCAKIRSLVTKACGKWQLTWNSSRMVITIQNGQTESSQSKDNSNNGWFLLATITRLSEEKPWHFAFFPFSRHTCAHPLSRLNTSIFPLVATLFSLYLWQNSVRKWRTRSYDTTMMCFSFFL